MFFFEQIAWLRFLIISVKNNTINRKAKVIGEITKKRSGNVLDLFISMDDKVWFYFRFTNGMMHTLSSDAAYNNTIQTLDAKERKAKSAMGEKSFIFILSPISKLNKLLKRHGVDPILTSNAAGQDIPKK